MSEYNSAVENVRSYIRSVENQKAVDSGNPLTAFQAAQVLAIAFRVPQTRVLSDLIGVTITDDFNE